MASLTERLTERGWRMTPQRRVISAVFDVSGPQNIHLTADEVLERAVAALPEISRATVYNTLGELVEAGELLSVRVGDRITRYDPNVSANHHHMVCNGCGAIFDVPARGMRAPHTSGVADGFVVQSTEVIYRGLCADCA